MQDSHKVPATSSTTSCDARPHYSVPHFASQSTYPSLDVAASQPTNALVRYLDSKEYMSVSTTSPSTLSLNQPFSPVHPSHCLLPTVHRFTCFTCFAWSTSLGHLVWCLSAPVCVPVSRSRSLSLSLGSTTAVCVSIRWANLLWLPALSVLPFGLPRSWHPQSRISQCTKYIQHAPTSHQHWLIWLQLHNDGTQCSLST